jgi:hypothetical protein
MRPTHRLDLVLVQRDPLRPPADGVRLLEELAADDVIDPSGGPGPRAREWCPGGFARVWLDRPDAAPDGLAFWSNRQGGFRVGCPTTHTSIVPAFGAAMARWRAGGPRTIACPACGRAHPLEALETTPTAAFGPWAVVTADAGEATLTPAAIARAERRLGASAVVLRRG